MTHKLAARFTAAASTARSEKGATGLEYAGMIAVAALVVGLVWTAIQGADVGGKISSAISDLFSPG
ncbi:hypothetical protein H9L10_13440 [Phycicoccus endophyticus]|uniref:Uncharacterized protein n=1 Tax=Phycicoccus endophyticus TaxID=1690220 RepID=A0A7G9R0T7_9MICO|nr:hypothetical protein [Phycicoccus endophyticus]NHI19502.1 hypothetical protein [Phycicoccus endophyticus]QNN49212.1 hypothetical protein H9L10_13440 [Phycicoccus endophyticus]GGL39654.1 hypothetical protein GCM10012283_22730 [Phycicoccus endophyticus]